MFQVQPQVTGTMPANETQSVDTESRIVIFFNVDLDRNHISDSISVFDDLARKVNVQFAYENRTVTIVPSPSLVPSTKYTVQIIGGLGSDKLPAGIRSVLDVALPTTYTFSFVTTATYTLDAPNLLSPANQSFTLGQPTFSWTGVPDSVGYEIQVSESPTMESILWPVDSSTTILKETAITPDLPFSDGIYYWMVRAIDTNGKPSAWSQIYTFNKDTHVQGTQASDDSLSPDQLPYYEEGVGLAGYDTTLEVIESFPADGGANVMSNLQTIYIRLLGTYDLNQIKPEMINITGMNVDGMQNNPDYPDHGEVKFTLQVLPQPDNTTLLKIILDVIPSQAYVPSLL